MKKTVMANVSSLPQNGRSIDMNDKKRVLFIKEGRALYGAERATCRLLKSLKRSNLDAEIIVMEYTPEPSAFLEDVIELDIPTYVVSSSAELGLRLKELAPEFDAMVTIGYKCHVLGWWYGRKFPWKTFAICHGWVNSDMKMRLYNALARACLKRFDGVMVVSPTITAKNARLTCVFNGVDVDELTTAAAAGTDPIAASPIILYVGRLEREKGVQDLLEAFYPLKNTSSLVLLGDGPMKKDLEQYVARYNMTDDVTFLGYRENPMPVIAQAAMVVLPSWSEGTPLIVLEAMAMGIPVVATSVGAIPAMMEHKYEGWLVNPRDVASLTKGLKLILAKPEDAADRAKEAKERVEREFTVQAVADRVESFILKTLRS